MLKECAEVFKQMLDRHGDRLILDSYIPADGTYLIVDAKGGIRAEEIKLDKKTRTVDRSGSCFPAICFYDYHSQLVSMNKPMDGKKIIHSNNYLSFFVKKDSIVSGKLTEEIIDGYYETLEHPVEKKYKKSREAAAIYQQFAEIEGEADIEAAEQNKRWIKEHIFALEGVDMSRKDYLKIFFEAGNELYEREGKRYLLPNIYNSNDYNMEIENTVYGLPDNNQGMNAKKPFLSVKSRKIPAPYLLDGQAVMLQKKFFDYLMNLVSSGRYNVYVDTELKEIHGCPNGEAPEKVETGYYLRARKGKTEAEIVSQDNIPGYNQKLNRAFRFKNVSGAKPRRHPEYQDGYRDYDSRPEVGRVINEVFFSNCLAGNYFTDAGDLSITDGILKQGILLARDAVFNWVFKGIDRGLEQILERVSLDLAKGSLLNGYTERAMWQLNLRWSFREYFSEEGEMDMAEIITDLKEGMEKKVLAKTTIPLDGDKEYYYAVGQLAAYLISLNKSKEKCMSLINPFLNAKTDEQLKKMILQLLKRYDYAIMEASKRVKNMLAMVEGYVPEGEVDQEMIVLGYASDNLIYTKEDK